MLPILLLAGLGLTSVHGHGGVVWPPTWQDGVFRGLDEVWHNGIQNNPVNHDPRTNAPINNAKQWVTDQSYTGGHGEDKQGKGVHTNTESCNRDWAYTSNNKNEAWNTNHAAMQCVKKRHPWAAPGVAPSLGGGCGIHGGNPYGCPAPVNGPGLPGPRDTRPPGSVCLSEEVHRGTWSYGTAAIDPFFIFPSIVTKWARGSIEPVGFVAMYHGGGYTYRLCKIPIDEWGNKRKEELTEECFIKNILKFAENKTYWRNSWQWWESPNQTNFSDEWQEEPKTDLTVGTYPEGSAWRYQGPIDYENFTERFYKDLVVVPEDLELGEYVLSWRWDAATAPQVWVSCSSIEIVDAI